MSKKLEIQALKVHQWTKEWEKVHFDKGSTNENRKRPEQFFFLFTIKAGLLKKLSKVYPRRTDEKREAEVGVQRKHDPERSAEISKYIRNGYPLSDLLKGKKSSEELEDLRMPGWLPTAIVANILKVGTKRGSSQIAKKDLIEVIDEGGVILRLPENCDKDSWIPEVPPLEIIDGQHRLWAFDPNDKITDDFELPVVAFYDLDITWQAYLFYTINVKPKKINRSLAYDLYPLLRVQEWLEKAPDTAFIYKETRAQEITEVVWSSDLSPFKDRINMLGEKDPLSNITQAAFIRNLIASFIKTSTTKGLGGLFGAKLNDETKLPLSWNRTQQASFIIFIWRVMADEVRKCKLEWAKQIRLNPVTAGNEEIDAAFISKYSLLSSDQGVRGFLHIMNDFTYILSEELNIRNIEWSSDEVKEDIIDHDDVQVCLTDFELSSVNKIVTDLCKELVKFDWRTSSEPHLSDSQRREQMVFKGSSGYKELRVQLLKLLTQSHVKQIRETAEEIIQELGYAK